MQAWDNGNHPQHAKIGPMGWLRILLRGGALGAITFGCLGVLLVVRLIERPLFGMARPVTPHITMFVCRMAFRILGMRRQVMGTPMHGVGAAVANHSSWLDIFALNASSDIYFVSKSEVAGWPGIGWLARATGTVFIERNPRRAREHMAQFTTRLQAGHRLMFFPEGTSTDGRRVLAFKTTLFQPFLGDDLCIQPVTLVYTAPQGADPRFYGWWGDMGFGPHLLQSLAAPRHGGVRVIYHPPRAAQDYDNRKAFAAQLERDVRDGFEKYLPTNQGTNGL